MSQDNPNAGAPQVMDPETAYAVVHQRVYAPVFFEKLAQDYGIRPQNETEAMEMMSMAAQLRSAHDTEVEKTASAGNPLLAGASAHLQQQLQARGYDTPKFDASAQMVKQAAAQASFDPTIAHAVLSLQAVNAHAAQQQQQPAA